MRKPARLLHLGCGLCDSLTVFFSLTVAAAVPTESSGQANPDDVYFPTATRQMEADEYTRYELLSPESASFKIFYEVSATTAGARLFYNPIRKGSIARDASVYDAMLGKPLHFEVVTGAQARKDTLMPDRPEAVDVLLKARRRVARSS